LGNIPRAVNSGLGNGVYWVRERCSMKVRACEEKPEKGDKGFSIRGRRGGGKAPKNL